MNKKIFSILVPGFLFLFTLALSTLPGAELPVVSDPSFKLSGYTQVGYNYFQGGTNSFTIERARLSLGGGIRKGFHYKLQVETVKTPVLLDAQVELSLFKQTRFKIGQFKIPFSLENLTSSADLDTIQRSQTVEFLCPGRDIKSKGRDIGILVLGKLSRLEYFLGLFNGSGINRTDDNKHKDTVGRVVYFPFDFLSLGIAHYRGKASFSPGTSLAERTRTGIEASVSKGGVSFKGECILGKDGNVSKEGWYIQGGVDLIPKSFQAIVRFDSLDLDKNASGDRREIITLGINWFFAKRTKLQVNYEFHSEENVKISNNIFLAQFQLGF